MQAGFIRIIGGRWRGRKLKVLRHESLRPTPDRVRETLFNWLSPYLAGAHCLDVFAGSGALGFEALSRGAAQVEMVDANREVIELLQSEAQTFGAENVMIYQAIVPKGLKKPAKPFDIVFLDPPYESDLLLPTCEYLETNGFLSEHALIYLESRNDLSESDLPSNWQLHKAKRAGDAAYHLALRQQGKI